MTKLRIHNNAKGQRGVYVAGELTFIDPGASRTISGFTEAEVAALSTNADFRVQRALENGEWEELSEMAVPEMRQWLAVASDSKGANYRLIELEPGEWFAGWAVASDEPDNASGFEWNKIGPSDAVVVTEEAAVASGEFDAVAYLDQAAAKLDLTSKDEATLRLLLAVEESEAGKKRKGVIADIKELLPADTENETQS